MELALKQQPWRWDFNAGTLSVVDSTILNSQAGAGGGIENAAGGTITISGTTISGNNSLGEGGGIDSAGALLIENSTIAGNAGTAGGGISTAGTLTTVNTTVAYNITSSGASSGGGLTTGLSGSTTLFNTIVAQNTDASGGDDLGGTGITTSSANNLVGVDQSMIVVGTNGKNSHIQPGTVAESINPIIVGAMNPGLNLLAPNGGPTLTIAILAGSPAAAAGNPALAADPTTDMPLATDQRGAGYLRIVNGARRHGRVRDSARSDRALGQRQRGQSYASERRSKTVN